MSFATLPRSTGRSEAGQRIIAAGLAYQQSIAAKTQAKEAAKEDLALKARIARVEAALASPAPNPDSAELPLRVPAPFVRRSDQIFTDAAMIFKLSKEEMLSRRGHRPYVLARFYLAQRIFDECGFSLPRIGRMLGGRDHTTVLHACKPTARKRVADWLAGREA